MIRMANARLRLEPNWSLDQERRAIPISYLDIESDQDDKSQGGTTMVFASRKGVDINNLF